jgi:hypothetical protein
MAIFDGIYNIITSIYNVVNYLGAPRSYGHAYPKTRSGSELRIEFPSHMTEVASWQFPIFFEKHMGESSF